MKKRINTNLEQIIKWRREIHKNPEIAYNEFETTEYLIKEMNKIGDFEILRPTKTGFVAVLQGAQKGRTVALRTDIDALPIEELFESDYKSLNPGFMHACGHDAHMSMVLAAASELYKLKDTFSGTVKFIFQHAEEVAPGGAIELVNSHVLDDVDYVIGLHVMPLFKSGTIYVCDGPATTAVDTFKIEVIGAGGHGSAPDLTIDPIMVAAEIISNINNIISRNTGLLDKGVISVCSINTPPSFNVIPNKVDIQGNIRTIDRDLEAKLKERINQVSEYVAKAHNATVNIQWFAHIDAVINDKVAADFVREGAAIVVGDQNVLEQPFITSSEDFSSYQRIIPGVLYRLGVGSKEEGITEEIHSPYFNLDEKSLKVGADVHGESVLLALSKEI